MKEKLAIIGSRSMVGLQTIAQLSENYQASLIRADIRGDIQVDITDPDSVYSFFASNIENFDWAVLFAAYTDVDMAEAQRDDKQGACWQINVEGTKNVAKACKKYSKKLIFISSDFVFDGTAGPYSEDDPIGPNLKKVSWYGISKIGAEKIVGEILKETEYLIIRISYPYSGIYRGKDDLALRTINYFEKNGKIYPLFGDQIITPTYIPDIAESISVLLAKGSRGIYNLASPKATTQFEFGRAALNRYFGRQVEIKQGKLADFLNGHKDFQTGKVTKPTPRPIKGGLKVDKIKSISVNPTSWEEGIAKIPQKQIDLRKSFE